MSSILSVVTVHDRPDLVFQQCLTYRTSFSDNVVQVVHINKACEPQFWADAKRMGVDFSKIPDIDFVSLCDTAWARVFHAHLCAANYGLRRYSGVQKVVFHTASDLMAKNGAAEHVLNHDLGAARSYAISEKDFWIDRVKSNPVLNKIVTDLQLDRPRKARVEGSFFSVDIFRSAFDLFCYYYPDLDYESFPAYPVEEIDWVCVVEQIAAKCDFMRARNMVLTCPAEGQLVSADKIMEYLVDPDVFGLKRFAPDVNDPARLRVLDLLKSV